MGYGFVMAKAKVDVEGVFERIDALVRQHGAIPKAELRALRKHLPALLSRLKAHGYEVGTNARVPIADQVARATSGGPKLINTMDIAGASAREIKEAVADMVSRGVLIRVATDAGVGVLASSKRESVVESADLASLLARLTAAQRLVRKAIATGSTVLRTDAGLSSPTQVASSSESLMIEIARRVAASATPLRVPELLRACNGSSVESKRALLDGARRGLFALQPESGMGRLSPHDADWCPQGPDGTLLSWVIASPRRTGART